MKAPASPALRALALYVVIFTQMLDTSVANLALPNIAADLFMDVYHASWVITSFGTGVVIAFPLGSLWTRRVSADFVLSVGCVLFIFASIGCAAASEPLSFIVFRFIQGAGSGLAVIVSFPLMIGILGRESTALAISLCTSAISLAPVLGPIVGAYITGGFGWRWLFLINVPLTCAGLALLLGTPTLPAPDTPEAIGPRLITLALFGICIACLQFVLDFGGQQGWLSSPRVTAALGVAGAAGAAFGWMNGRRASQVFDFAVFRSTGYAAATTILVVGNGLIFASLVLLPIWLRLDRGMPILHAGLIVSLASGVAAVAAPFAGKYLARRHYPHAAIASLALTALSFLMMSRFTADSSLQFMVLARLLAGCGLALFAVSLITLSLAALPAQDIINGNSISIVLRVVSSNVLVAMAFAAYQHFGSLAQGEFTANADRLSYLRNPAGGLMSGTDHLAALFHTRAMAGLFFGTGIFFALGSVALLPFAAKMTRRQVAPG